MNQPPFKQYLEQCRQRVDRALTSLVPGSSSDHQLFDAMGYSLLSGGKRVRPLLVYAAAKAVDNDEFSALDNVACSVECIHAYSLIHDDLPAMDDDDLRRGQPTCHKQYDEATAILAGDALQTLAFRCLADNSGLSPDTRLQLLQQLIKGSGTDGMITGQAIDLAAVDHQLSLSQLQRMHSYKTGALIHASVLMGAIATEQASEQQLQLLGSYADAIGLAFQVQDDILDVTADTETLGKQQGADAALNKPTYVSLLGLDGAMEKAGELYQQALTALESFDKRAASLRQIADYIVRRSH